MARVMIIDDSPEIREVLVEMLGEVGHEAASFAHPDDALAGVEPGKVDVILCDLVLPYELGPQLDETELSAMVGVHAMKLLAARFPKVPIVAMSGHLPADSLGGMANFGASGALAKPFRQSDLMAALDRVLPRRSGVPVVD